MPNLGPLPFQTLFADNRRAIRARYPNGNPETEFYPDGFTSASSWLPPKAAASPVEIHIPSPARSFAAPSTRSARPWRKRSPERA